MATVLRNFERYVVALKEAPNVTWTNVAGIKELYINRPVCIARRHLEEFAQKVVGRRGPAYTDVLTAAEGLVLLARAILSPAEFYEVPTVMGPLSSCKCSDEKALPDEKALIGLAEELICRVYGTGFLPSCCKLPGTDLGITPDSMVLRLSLAFLGSQAEAVGEIKMGETTLMEGMNAPSNKEFASWMPHGSQYGVQNIVEGMALQAWTFKPAFQKGEYADDIQTAPL